MGLPEESAAVLICAGGRTPFLGSRNDLAEATRAFSTWSAPGIRRRDRPKMTKAMDGCGRFTVKIAHFETKLMVSSGCLVGNKDPIAAAKALLQWEKLDPSEATEWANNKQLSASRLANLSRDLAITLPQPVDLLLLFIFIVFIT